MGADFVIYTAQVDGGAIAIGLQHGLSYGGILLAENVEISIAPFTPVVDIEGDGAAVVGRKPADALTEMVHIVRRDNTDSLRANRGVSLDKSQRFCNIGMAATAIGVAAVCVVHGCRAVYGEPYEKISLCQPVQAFRGQQCAVGRYAEPRRHDESLSVRSGVFVAPLQQLPFHQWFAAEKTDIGSLTCAPGFIKHDVNGALCGFPAHGVAIFSPGVTVLTAQGTIVGQAEGAGDDVNHVERRILRQFSRKLPRNARRNMELVLF